MMSYQSLLTDRFVSPAQVWARLAVDCRAQVIRLMAQLAFNLVAAQSDSPVKESNHVIQPEHTQNPA
jgi:hypothetical protein